MPAERDQNRLRAPDQSPANLSIADQSQESTTQASLNIAVNDLKNFRIAFTSENVNDKQIKSIDFSYDGMIALYNTNKLIKLVKLHPARPIESKYPVDTHGAGICKFLYKPDMLIHTSSISDHHLRLLNYETVQYDRYFNGHMSEVTSIDVSRNYQNIFASASLENELKLWDFRNSNAVYSGIVKQHPIVAFHPEELILAIAYSTDKTTYVIDIMDIRNMKLDERINKFYFKNQDFKWIAMKFSNNGKYLMVNTDDNNTNVVDYNNGRILHNFTGYKNIKHEHVETCFTPDTKYVLGGSDDGKVHIWNLETSEKEAILDKPVAGSSRKIIFNSVFMCFATAGEKFHLWIEK